LIQSSLAEYYLGAIAQANAKGMRGTIWPESLKNGRKRMFEFVKQLDAIEAIADAKFVGQTSARWGAANWRSQLVAVISSRRDGWWKGSRWRQV
jgi:hypothetical protein